MRGGVDDEDDDDGGSDDNGARRRHDLYLHAMLLQCKIKKKKKHGLRIVKYHHPKTPHKSSPKIALTLRVDL